MKLLTVTEVARMLRVDDTTVRRWVKNGALEGVALPHKSKRQQFRIPSEAVEAILAPKE